MVVVDFADISRSHPTSLPAEQDLQTSQGATQGFGFWNTRKTSQLERFDTSRRACALTNQCPGRGTTFAAKASALLRSLSGPTRSCHLSQAYTHLCSPTTIRMITSNTTHKLTVNHMDPLSPGRYHSQLVQRAMGIRQMPSTLPTEIQIHMREGIRNSPRPLAQQYRWGPSQ